MDKIQTIKERILIFVKMKNLKSTTFYNETGMSASNFKGAALKSDLGVEKLAKIVAVYPELNYNKNLTWLITGNGELTLNKMEDQQDADLPYNSEELGDFLANLFAQSNAQNKDIMFITSQLLKVVNEVGDIKEKVNEILINQRKYSE